MDYSGGYEEKVKRFLPLVVAAITAVVVIVTAPSGFFGKARREMDSIKKADQAHFKQFCDLQVPTLMPSAYPDDELVQEALAFESTAAYR